MRHRTVTKTFGRSPNHRQMLYKQLVTNIIAQGRIVTTLARAKAVRALLDRMISYALDGTLTAQRRARRFVLTREAFVRLFGEVRTDFQELSKRHTGGYSRMMRWKMRAGDNAPLVLLELLNYKPKKKEPAAPASGSVEEEIKQKPVSSSAMR